MNTIDVCLSPELVSLYDIHNRTVVIVDILRATSCMVTAFAHGAECIVPMDQREACRKMGLQGYITAGEYDGKKIEGFDKGNSPFDYMNGSIKGKKIAFTTTNGTQAIVKVKNAKKILIGSFLNINALACHLLMSKNDILVLCAGWKGKFNLEDTLFAGALVDRLSQYVVPDCDAPLMARHLYDIAKNDVMGFLQQSSHTQRLQKLSLQRDIAHCLDYDRYNVIPVFEEGRLRAI